MTCCDYSIPILSVPLLLTFFLAVCQQWRGSPLRAQPLKKMELEVVDRPLPLGGVTSPPTSEDEWEHVLNAR